VTDPPNVLLRLSNGAENVALVRQALSGVAEQLELEAGAINDIRTAATEACNNVSLHAYDGEEGPLEVEIGCGADALEVVVRDHGGGIRPLVRAREDNALGIGLAIIQALTRRVEFNDPPGGGTEVRMEFPAKPAGGFDTARTLRWVPDGPGREELASTTAVAIAPSRLARTVLPRVLTVLAARAGFTTDRISDVQLIADALAAQADGAGGSDEVRLTARVSRRRMALAVGPLARGVARALLEGAGADGIASVIEKLSDEHRVDGAPGGSEATLVLALGDRA
jgi:anti-sigma regulatory factor (Ser/Thr protein kinase)